MWRLRSKIGDVPHTREDELEIKQKRIRKYEHTQGNN